MLYMARWKRGTLWLLAGTAVLVAGLVVSILGGDEDAKGAKLAVAVTVFYVVFVLGAALSVRGVLIFVERFSTGGAIRLALVAFAAIILAILLHNLVYALFEVEEPFFFILALWAGPVALVAAIIRAFRPARPHDPHAGAPVPGEVVRPRP